MHNITAILLMYITFTQNPCITGVLYFYYVIKHFSRLVYTCPAKTGKLVNRLTLCEYSQYKQLLFLTGTQKTKLRLGMLELYYGHSNRRGPLFSVMFALNIC